MNPRISNSDKMNDNDIENHKGRNTEADEGLVQTQSEAASASYDSAEQEAAIDAIAGQGLAKVSSWVRRLRALVLAVLVVSTVVVSIVIYRYLERMQREEFEHRFEGYSTKVLDSISETVELTIGSLGAFQESLSSCSKAMNVVFPFVTVPDFAERASAVLWTTGGKYLTTAHIVQSYQRSEWENYTALNNQWVDESIEFQNYSSRYGGAVVENYTTWDVIWGTEEVTKAQPGLTGTDSPGPYMPLWQDYPVIPYGVASYNWDVMQDSFFESATDAIIKGSVMLTPPRFIPDPPTEADDMLNRVISNFYVNVLDDEDPYEPMSYFLYPIFEPQRRPRTNTDSRKSVGTIGLSMYWRDLFKNILSQDGHQEVFVVVENECSDPFTYYLRGEEVVFQGRGALYNKKYGHLQDSRYLFGSSGTSYTSKRTNVDVQKDKCQYKISVYPSSASENGYINENDPLWFTIVVVTVFLFTSIIFFLYDFVVERRQRAVMYSATMSKTTVSILERLVQDRTKKLAETNIRLEEANKSVTEASALQLQHFACMSHEIRTPLNCIIGCASLLRDSQLDDLQKDSAEMIVTSGNLLMSVVNDVLDYSKLESGNVDIDYSRTNLQELLDAVIWSMQAKARNRDVVVTTHYDVLLPETMETDSRRVQQVLYNLLGNAVKFSKESGRVEMNVSVSTPTHTERAYYPSATIVPDQVVDEELPDCLSHVIRFVVKDYGKGIPRSMFPKIFHPFLQESANTETLYGGSGLGLAISSKLVHRLGGTISVDSQVGEWTEFAVELPLRNPCQDLEFLANVQNSSRVVVVDNDRLVRERMGQVFGYYTVDFTAVNSIRDVPVQSREESNSPQIILLVNEDLLVDSIAELPSNSIVITTGTKHASSCSMKTHGHIRSLLQMIPRVLLRNLAQSLPNQSSEGCSLPDIAATDYQTALSLDSLSILVAEDNLINQKVLGRILQRLCVKDVEMVTNGQLAVDLIRSGRYFDVVLMDMQMPVMDGLQACSHIRNSGLAQRPKVIFVTAHAHDSYEEECYKAGAVDFITKPCNIETVRAVLERNIAQ